MIRKIGKYQELIKDELFKKLLNEKINYEYYNCWFIHKDYTSFSQFFFILPGTEFDVLNFHNEAIRFSTHLDQNFFGFKNYDYKSGWYISNFLGLFYYFFGNYLVVGGVISCLVWFFSAIIFRKTLINLGSSLKVLDAATLFYTFIFQ